MEKTCIQTRPSAVRLKRKRKRKNHQSKKALLSSGTGKYFGILSIDLITASYFVPQLTHHPPAIPRSAQQAMLNSWKPNYIMNIPLHRIMKVSTSIHKICFLVSAIHLLVEVTSSHFHTCKFKCVCTVSHPYTDSACVYIRLPACVQKVLQRHAWL